jgi:hypothetical protein
MNDGVAIRGISGLGRHRRTRQIVTKKAEMRVVKGTDRTKSLLLMPLKSVGFMRQEA